MDFDHSTLEAAIIGLKLQREKLNELIEQVEKRLKLRPSVSHAIGEAKTRRPISAAARKRMAAGQRKRWAAYRAQGKAGKAVHRTKRILSPAQRQALAANLAKARAAKAAAQAKP